MRSEFAVLDRETGRLLEGKPSDELIAVGRGEAWRKPFTRADWRLRGRHDPPGTTYRLVQVVGGPDLDPYWYENTVENLDTSEGD
jgi:hypothetical protein